MHSHLVLHGGVASCVDAKRSSYLQHPEVWQRVLLRLCPAACAHLLDYWDTLQHNPGNSAKPGGSATSTATEATHDTVVVEARGKELDSFFAALFSPCGDNVSEVRCLFGCF